MSLVRNLLVATLVGAAFPVGCTAITEKSPKEAFPDAEIITRAKAMFAADPVVKARNIHVTAVKGDVTLTGVVKSVSEADRALLKLPQRTFFPVICERTASRIARARLSRNTTIASAKQMEGNGSR